MFSRQSVKVTYARKRRRAENASKKFSSPLEVLPPDMGDLTRTQMARRMLKRSRRVALVEQLEDKNVEHIREHLAKRIKCTQERASNFEPSRVPPDTSPKGDFTFQTPFHFSQSVHESTVVKSLVPDQLSPVPAAKRIMSRTSSGDLKENSAHQVLASPFSSRPGSAAPSPKHKGKGPSTRRVPRTLHAKSRTISGIFKENARRVSRKDSTVSLKDGNKETYLRHHKHRRYPSGPSAAYMRSQFAQEDWIAPPKAFSRDLDDYDVISSPGVSVHSNASFYTDQPQSCSTPATSRLRNLRDLRGRQGVTNDSLVSFSRRKDSAEIGGSDVGMTDDTVLSRRQTIHLSGNSIFSSSAEFTIGSLPAMHDGGTVDDATRRNETPNRVAHQVPAHLEAAGKPKAGHSLAGSFIAEYAISLSDINRSPAAPSGVSKSSIGRQCLALPGTSPAYGENLVIRMSNKPRGHKSSTGEQLFGLPGTSPAQGDNLIVRAVRNPAAPRSSVGEQLLGLPGTSPARSENLVIGVPSRPGIPKSSVGEQLLGLPGTSPCHGESLVIRTSRNLRTLTPLASPLDTGAACPPSPASDLALELQSIDISVGDAGTHSDAAHHSPLSTSLQARSRSLQDASSKSNTKRSARRHVRNRAGTIRPSDFATPSILSGAVSGTTTSSLSNVRRTRSGTIVGPESKLAAKGAGLPTQQAKGVSATKLAVVRPGSDSESDDELLLKGFWTEDLEYLGPARPEGGRAAEADELNLGGLWHGLEYAPRRAGLRRR